jgi:hypothetical protein
MSCRNWVGPGALRCGLVLGVVALAGCAGRSFEDNARSLGAAGAGSTSDASPGGAAIGPSDGSASNASSAGNATSDEARPSDAPAIELAASAAIDVFVGKLGILAAMGVASSS